jgi:hypothetical protein
VLLSYRDVLCHRRGQGGFRIVLKPIAGVHCKSINGPFLGTLGASAAIVSMVAGVGEFLGYSLRSVAGYVADRTGRHWLLTFIGYGINLLAVPAMALAPSPDSTTICARQGGVPGSAPAPSMRSGQC